VNALLTIREAQEEYHLGRDFVRRLIRDRKIPVISLGPHKILLPRDGLEAFLQKQTIPARREYFKSHNQHP